MTRKFPEPKRAWIQTAPFGPIYVEASSNGVSRVEFKVPVDAKDLGEDASVAAAFDSYFAGSLSAFDDVAIDLSTLTEFRRVVVETLRLIPAGQTLTYKELGEKVGVPKGARAIGQAVGDNPVGIVAPCHRVLAASQKLGGFSGGLDNKRWLLAHEGVHYSDN